MTKPVKRITAALLMAVMLFGFFVMPSTPVKADTETPLNTEATYDINKLEGYELVKGKESNAKDEPDGGFTLKSGTVLERHPDALGDKPIINYVVYTIQVADVNGTALTAASAFNMEIITSYLDAENYRFLRIQHDSSEQIAYYGNVSNGICNPHFEKVDTRNSEMGLIDFTKAVAVTVDKRGTSSVVTLTDGTNSWTVDIPTIEEDKQTLALGGTTTYHRVVITYSNIQVTSLSQGEAARYRREYDRFANKYAELLYLTEQYQTKNYQSVIEAALAEYALLSDYVKARLAPQMEKLEALYTELENASMEEPLQFPDRKNMVYTNAFDGGIVGFTNFSSSAVVSEIVTEDGNNVLVMKDSVDPLSGLMLKHYMVPEDSVLSKVSYDFRVGEYVEWQQMRFMLAYKDASNYTYLSLEIQTNNRFAMDIFEVVDGIKLTRQNYLLETSLAEQTDFTKWGHVDLIYVGNSVNILLSVNGVAFPGTSHDCSFAPLKPVLLASSASNTYIDNVSLAYKDYVATSVDESEKLAVYYTGNTEQYPNDTVMVTGNNILENVSSIQIKEIANTNDFGAQSYIKTDWYGEIGYEGTYIHSTSADYSEEAWANAVTVEILQPTEGTLKFLIPKEFTKGMYAVRFNGFDYTSSEDDVIYYINRARVSFVSGDEGKITTAGGTLKIVGDMLVWGYNKEVNNYPNVKVLIKGKDESFLFDQSDFTVESASGIVLSVPADMELGTYEVSVYNGIGGTDGWSAPVQMTVGESPRASWPKEVFNVKDFGANGQNWQNATGAVVKALEAAALNGGGVVYFPEGQYNLCNSIVIPENVVVKGDGSGKSIVFWSMDMWPDGSLPSYVVGFTSNVEFRDLGFYACRVNDWFVSREADVKNVYFNNLYVYTDPFAQYATNANSGADGSGIDREELFDMIREEISRSSMVFNIQGGDMSEDGAQNIRFDNVTLKQSGTYGILRGFSTKSDYFYANEFSIYCGAWITVWGGSCAVWQNSEFQDTTMSVLGDGMYFYNNYLHDKFQDNRELFVADFPMPDEVYSVKKRDDMGSEATGDKDCWYEIVGGGFSGVNSLRFYQLKVIDGQGYMQTRCVEYSEGNLVRLNSPFAVTPDGNSVVQVREGRQDSYFIHNTLDEGGTGMGWFSGTVGVVYDGNVRTRSGLYIYVWGNDAIWYMSFVNEDFDEPYMFGGYGYHTGNQDNVSNDHGGYTSLHVACGPSQPAGALLGFTVRRCQFQNGSYIDFVFSLGDDSARGIVLEDNVFDRVSQPIIFYSTYGGLSNFDGALVRNNVYTRVDTVLETSGAANLQGSPRILVMNDKTTASGESLAKGDVNGDGKVSLKDVSVLKYYLADMIVLDQDALARADVNSSGLVTLKDASTIRHYVTYGAWILNYVDVPDDNGGFFGGNW